MAFKASLVYSLVKSVVADHHQEWTKKGIVGRGVLIDYHSYALAEGILFEPWPSRQISVDDIKQITERKKITLQVGDILLLRTGESIFSYHTA